MDILPEWAPNVHPMLVHFPIALLCAAVLLDAVALAARKQAGLRIAAVLVYVLGAVGALASYLTGKNAADAFLLSGAANTALTDHADWATITVWFFGIYALVRLAVLWWDRDGKKVVVWVPLLLIGAGGLFLIYETAEHGAQMVFEHGVGVKAVGELEAQVAQQKIELDKTRAQAAGPEIDDDGSWRWTPGAYAAEAFHEAFTWMAGDIAVLRAEARPDDEQGHVLALEAAGTPALFVLDQPLRSLQADLALNLDDFDGALQIVHHVQDSINYLFTEIEGGAMRQGRVQNGQPGIMDEKAFAGQGWQQLRVVADRTHFRAYAGGTLITHGHGPEPAPGLVGLRLDGTGIVLVGRIEVQSLR